jgi:exonuclease VII large subunit
LPREGTWWIARERHHHVEGAARRWWQLPLDKVAHHKLESISVRRHPLGRNLAHRLRRVQTDRASARKRVEQLRRQQALAGADVQHAQRLVWRALHQPREQCKPLSTTVRSINPLDVLAHVLCDIPVMPLPRNRLLHVTPQILLSPPPEQRVTASGVPSTTDA